MKKRWLISFALGFLLNPQTSHFAEAQILKYTPFQAIVNRKSAAEENLKRVIQDVNTGYITPQTADYLMKFDRAANVHREFKADDGTNQWSRTKLGNFNNFEDFKKAVLTQAAKSEVQIIYTKGPGDKVENVERGLTNIVTWSKLGSFGRDEWRKLDEAIPTDFKNQTGIRLSSESDIGRIRTVLYRNLARQSLDGAKAAAENGKSKRIVGAYISRYQDYAALAKLGNPDDPQVLDSLGFPEAYYQRLKSDPAVFTNSPSVNPSAYNMSKTSQLESGDLSYKQTPLSRVEGTSMDGFVKSMNTSGYGGMPVISLQQNHDMNIYRSFGWQPPAQGNSSDNAFEIRKQLRDAGAGSRASDCPEGSSFQTAQDGATAMLACVSNSGGSKTITGPIVSAPTDSSGHVIPGSSVTVTSLDSTGNIGQVVTVNPDGKVNTDFSRTVEANPDSNKTNPNNAATNNTGSSTTVASRPSDQPPTTDPNGNISLAKQPAGTAPFSTTTSGFDFGAELAQASRNNTQFQIVETTRTCQTPNTLSYYPTFKNNQYDVYRSERKPGMKAPTETVVGNLTDSLMSELDKKPSESIPYWYSWVAQERRKENVFSASSVSSSALPKDAQQNSPSCIEGGHWVKLTKPIASWMHSDHTEVYVCVPNAKADLMKPEEKSKFGSYVRLHKDSKDSTLYTESGRMDIDSGVPVTRSILKTGDSKPMMKQEMVRFGNKGNTVLYKTTVDLCTHPERVIRTLTAKGCSSVQETVTVSSDDKSEKSSRPVVSTPSNSSELIPQCQQRNSENASRNQNSTGGRNPMDSKSGQQ